MHLQEILNELEIKEKFTAEWYDLMYKKSRYLEDIKPSTNEIIVAFREDELHHIPMGFVINKNKLKQPYLIGKRSYFEYGQNMYRHPIPYVVVKYKDKYFFILREKGSGETRLIGQIGLLGGHIQVDNINKSFWEIVEDNMYRELKEEAGITKDMIIKQEFLGYIKTYEGVSADHLGLVYLIELNTDNIQSEEEGIIDGFWVEKNDLIKYKGKMESWCKYVLDKIENIEAI